MLSFQRTTHSAAQRSSPCDALMSHQCLTLWKESSVMPRCKLSMHCSEDSDLPWLGGQLSDFGCQGFVRLCVWLPCACSCFFGRKQQHAFVPVAAQEERRLFYVALTRAQRRVIVSLLTYDSHHQVHQNCPSAVRNWSKWHSPGMMEWHPPGLRGITGPFIAIGGRKPGDMDSSPANPG